MRKLSGWLTPFIAGIFSTLGLFAACGYFILASGSIDPGADQPIPQWERWAAKTSIRAYLKKNTPETKNPLKLNNENLEAGCSLYVNNCAFCHGLADAKKNASAEGFYKGAPVFVKEAEEWAKDPDGLIYWFIEHGVRLTAMPAYKKSLSETEKWQIVMFIKEMYRLPEPVDKKWKSIESLEISR